MPFIVIIALVLAAVGGGSSKPSDSGPLGVLKVAAPPDIARQEVPCTALIEALPLQLKALAPRQVEPTPPTPFVVAWGNPAIVVRCGVAKPAGLNAGSNSELIAGGDLSGAYYFVSKDGDANVYTAVDRQAYVSFTIPGKYQGADYLPILNAAVLKAMPEAVCSTDPKELDVTKLCDRRTG